MYLCLGDPVNIHPDQPVRVLPARGGDHTPHLPRRPLAWQISNIRHDSSFLKVSTIHLHYGNTFN